MADEKEKRLEPVVDQTYLVKRNSTRSAVKTFFPESLASVGNYIVKDILIPAVKNLLDDTISKGTHALLWGNSSGVSRSRSREDSVSYERYYKKPSTQSQLSSSSRLNKKYTSVYDYADVEFTSMGKAEKVLMNMRAAINRYKVCSVRDMYDLAETMDENGKPVGSPADARYGWYSLAEDEARVVSSGGKWYLDLPKAVPLDE